MQENEELPYLAYNRSLISYAKENRKKATKAEGLFRNLVVKNKRFCGYKFRRQKVIDSFILDFYCPQLLLGIEIDGRYHENEEQRQYDEMREACINKHHILIVRFTNEEIEKNLFGVMNELEAIIDERKQNFDRKLIIKDNHYL
ncbi:endonuclease [candidate division SR1 bacterium]|nr:endonuclease [candidate division SR1 bacterium]